MELKNLELIGAGFHAEVFRIGSEAIKCPYRSNRENYSIREEFEMQKQLFAVGIKVPEPYEILEVQLKNRTVKAMRMEFIEGKNIEKLRMDQNKIIAEKLYYQELDRAIALGFQPYDVDLCNAVYSKNRGVYLIDFDGWRRE